VNCRQVIEFLMDYVDGELPEHVKMCFDMHLEVCPPCIEYLKTYQETIVLAKDCCKEDPNCRCDEMPEQLITAILVSRKTQPT
jgi:predicted anti-sigma-YlaC factor YlaD